MVILDRAGQLAGGEGRDPTRHGSAPSARASGPLPDRNGGRCSSAGAVGQSAAAGHQRPWQNEVVAVLSAVSVMAMVGMRAPGEGPAGPPSVLSTAR